MRLRGCINGCEGPIYRYTRWCRGCSLEIAQHEREQRDNPWMRAADVDVEQLVARERRQARRAQLEAAGFRLVAAA